MAQKQQLTTSAAPPSMPISNPLLKRILDCVALISYGKSRAVPEWQQSISTTTVTSFGIFNTRRLYKSSSKICPALLKSNGINVCTRENETHKRNDFVRPARKKRRNHDLSARIYVPHHNHRPHHHWYRGHVLRDHCNE